MENAIIFSCKSLNLQKKKEYFDFNHRRSLKREYEDCKALKRKVEAHNRRVKQQERNFAARIAFQKIDTVSKNKRSGFYYDVKSSSGR